MADGIRKRQILLNAFTSFIQMFVIGASLFLLYKYLLRLIGAEQLGIWSLVLAASSVASVTRKGISGSAVKYVAKYLARGEEETVCKVVETTIITIGLLSAATLCVTYPLVKWILMLIVPADKIEIAHAILPHAIISIWVMILASVYYAGLDGYQRTDLRSWTLTGGALFLLVLACLVVPAHGIIGLAYAQVAQSLFVFLLSWKLLKNKLRILPFFPRRWDKPLFREMFSYGLNLQIINILQIFSDPVTKAMLTKFGDLSMTAYYEMASRMVVQLRNLIVVTYQVIVPTIADLHEKGSELLPTIYRKSYHLVLYVSVPFYSAIAVLTPAISHLWIGHYERMFVLFTYILIVGWFLNTLIIPSYFSNLGTGEVKWNTVGHVVIGVLNIVLCFLLGKLYGGKAVVVAWVISLATGSLLITFIYHRRYCIPLRELVPREHASIAIGSLAGLAMAFNVYHFFKEQMNIWVIMVAMVPIYIVFVFIPLWVHPIRERFAGWIFEAFFRDRKAGLKNKGFSL